MTLPTLFVVFHWRYCCLYLPGYATRLCSRERLKINTAN